MPPARPLSASIDSVSPLASSSLRSSAVGRPLASLSGSRRTASGVVRAARRGARRSELVFMVFASGTTLRSSLPDAAEDLFQTEERLEAGRIPKAAPVDRAGILDEVDRGGRPRGGAQAAEAPPPA